MTLLTPDEFRRELALVPWIQKIEDLPDRLRAACLANPELKGIVRERIRLDACLDQVPEIVPEETFVFQTVQRAWRDAGEGQRVGDVPDAPGVTGGRQPSTLRLARRLRPAWIAAAALAAGIVIGLLAGPFLGGDDPEPELLARLDFLLDIELIEANRPGLDVVRTSGLMEAVADLSDLREDG